MSAVQLQQEFVGELLNSINGSWTSLEVHFEYYQPREDEPASEIYVAKSFSGDSYVQFDPSLEALDALVALRDDMANNGKEPWTWCIFTIDSSGKYSFDFKYGVPPFVAEELRASRS